MFDWTNISYHLNLKPSTMRTKFIFLLFIINVIGIASSTNLPTLMQPNYFDNDTVQWFPEIVGGTPIQLDQMNGVVSIQNRYGHHLCSGTLVSYKLLLTAADCLINQDGDLLDTSEIRIIADDIVIVGDGTSTRQIQEVEKFYYQPRSGIAIIELLNSFNETSTLTYTEISNDTVSDGQICQLIGWGSSKPKSEVILQQINVKIMSNEVANSSKYYNSSMPTNTIAATALDENSSCFGDLGSALVCDDFVNGILSFGYGCNRSDFPIIFYNTYDNDLMTETRVRMLSKPSSSKPSASKPSKPGIKYPIYPGGSTTCKYNQYGEWVCSRAGTIKLSIAPVLFIIIQYAVNKFVILF